MAKTNLGRVMPVDKGLYSSATTYDRLDMVRTSDSTYVSKVDTNRGHAVTDTNYWTCYANGKPATEIAAQVAEAEALRVAAEQSREAAEGQRVTAEQGRESAEQTREDNEEDRQSQESARVLAETSRATAESARENAEQARVSAETSRASAESSRASAETARESQAVSDHEIASSDHTTAVADHTRAEADHTTAEADHTIVSGYNTRLTNIEGEVSQLGQEIFPTIEIDGMTLGVLQNGPIDVDGGLTSTSTNYRRRIIPNDGYTRIVGHGSSYTPRPILAFYNSSNPGASSFISGVPSIATYTDQDFDVLIPEGTETIIVSYAVVSPATTAVATLYKEENRFDDIEGRVQTLEEKVEVLGETTDALVIRQAAIKKTPSDFTTTGLWKTGVAEIDPSYSNYRAIALLDVVEGQVITWHKWQHWGSAMASVAAIFCYDNDGLPYNGSSARINYDTLTTHNYDTGEFTFKIPSNCSQIGLAYNFTTYPAQDGAEIIISEESVALTDLAKELINNSVEQGDEVGDDSAKYYLKGNSNIVYSPAKKLGIIAAGQSNIDGRNSYSDLPSDFVNLNAKVRFCNNVNGTFADFQVTDGGQNNDWSFDAIVYDLLTKAAYGNQDEIYVMKKSMGGTSIDPMGATDYHWTADYEFLQTSSASLLRSFEEIVRAGVASAGANFDIKAMLWHQGEGDMQNEEVANRYYENLKNMLAYVRGVVGNPRLYFFCGNISLNRTSPEFVNIINAAYTKLASEDPYFKVVDMSNAQLEDGYHFNYQWSIYFGQKVYDLMIDAGIITGTKINPSEPS